MQSHTKAARARGRPAASLSFTAIAISGSQAGRSLRHSADDKAYSSEKYPGAFHAEPRAVRAGAPLPWPVPDPGLLKPA
ncbi:MAG: hypothetical protein WDN04_11900 [Rhodospirillales bacterium]